MNTVIKVENVTKSYNSLKAVDDLCFTVNEAACFGLLGPNGAGKTTMMKILYGKSERDNPEPGQVNVLGYDPLVNELEIKFLSGIVPQEDNLDAELSVIQNLVIYSRFYGLSKKKSMPRIEYLLNFMDLYEKRDSRIKELSGGMKRRLTIARALINSPKLLILDEPTTGLDPQVRHVIWDKMRLLKKEGVTILLTTHYMDEAFQMCDSLIIMNSGKKVLEGEPSKLVSDNIKSYVLEIFHKENAEHIKPDDDLRIEYTDTRALLYSDKLDYLNSHTTNLETGDYYLRQSNLEDVFLKITGRKLND